MKQIMRSLSVAFLLVGLISIPAFAQRLPDLGVVNDAETASQVQFLLSTFASSAQPLGPSITVTAGTHVLMVLRHPLHSTSGVEGSGIYLETLEPVIQSNQIVIPAHTQVQGIVEANKRPGHFQRTAEFKFRFTTLIFPNNHVVTINGALQSIPGAPHLRKHQNDGKLKTVDQTEKVVVSTIIGATGGALLGSVSGLGIGRLGGGGLGGGLGLEASLLRRGDDIYFGNGTQMEMVLESPFFLDPEQAAFNAQYAKYSVPAANRDHAPVKHQTSKRKDIDPRDLRGMVHSD